MKKVIYLGVSVGGMVGGLIGSRFDNGSFGVWGIVLSLVGSLLGIYAGYKISA
jgi:uncharacterized membrane protein